jgi:deazaflavin-dependent oxidoreductase (nitroreductase family)
MTMERPEGLDASYVPTIIKAMSRANVFLYRATGGFLGGTWRVMSAFRKPVPVCLLTTVGKKSGAERTTPLLCMPDGDRVILVASQGGLPKNPLWYGNLVANPLVTIQMKRQISRYRARTATPAERAALWPRLVDLYADFASYAAWTDREIPVVVCEPIS